MKAVKFLPASYSAALLFAALLPSAFAQTAAPASPAAAPAALPQDETLVLSPFVVSSASESGYQATETLAGMRVRTNLKDVGAAIDVLTDSFLNDVGAVDMNDALKYVANMQYASFPGAQDASNASQWFSSSYISRGIVGSTVLIDFFPTGSVPIDRYNTENLTMMRGPNAILFGIGSPSGIVGASTKRALLNRNVRSVRFMTDTNESMRTEFDFSQVLIPDKLALRLAAVFSDRHTDQNPSLERRNAVFGTATWKPFKKTMITVNAENGIRNRLFVQNQVTMDAYTPWVLAGKPMVTSRIGFPATGAAYSTAVGSGLQNQSNGSYLVQIHGSDLPIMDWRGMARGSQWGNMVPGTAAYTPGTMLNTDRSVMDNISFTPDNTIVPLNANILGDNNRNDLNYQTKSIFIEQNILRDLDLELAWNQFTSDYLFKIHAYSNNAKIFVDPNVYLPNGAANPYAGMPYIETGTGGNGMRETGSEDKYITKRATLSYRLDLDKKKIFGNVGFGDYRLAGLAQDANYTQKLLSTRLVNVTPVPGNPTANPLNQAANRVSHRYYLQPGESGFRIIDPLLVSQPNLPGAPAANNGPIKIEERMSDESPRNNRQDTESFVVAVQGAWWKSKDDSYSHLTGMYGWRQDTQRNAAQSFTRNAQGEYSVPVTPHRAYDLIEPNGVWGTPTEFTARTKSYNATFRPISPVRLFYNFSDIFRAPAANFFDVWGNPLRSAFGETEDYGIKLDLFKERVFLSVTKYKTTVVDTTQDNTGSLREPINQLYQAIQTNGAPSSSESAIISEQLDNLIRPFSYRDDGSEGYEVALTASPLKNWNMRLTFGTQKTIVAAAFDDWVPYFEEFRPLWQKYSTVGLVTTSAGYTTVADAIARADQRLIDQRSIIGQQPTDQRGENSSFNTTYSFTEGRLRGLRVGGGYRWASANVLGYARDASGNLDREKPFKGAEEFMMDLNLAYTFKFGAAKKYAWDIQLNVYNLLDDTDIKYRQAVDNGQGMPVITRTYLPEPRTFQLTNTIRF